MKGNNKNVVLAVLGVILLGMTIAYASLQTNLNIGGTVDAPAVEWDVHFTNFAKGTVVGSATGPTAAELGNKVTATSISNLAISLPKPGDSITYTWDIVNTGSIDAKLNSYSAGWTCDTGKDCTKISYQLSCTNGGSTQNSILVKTTGTSTCTLKVSRAEATVSGANQTYSDAAASGVINATWNYVQN